MGIPDSAFRLDALAREDGARHRLPDHVKYVTLSFKVMLPDGLAIAGAVLADQVKSIDRRARGLQVAGSAPASVLAEVRAKVAALLQIDA